MAQESKILLPPIEKSKSKQKFLFLEAPQKKKNKQQKQGFDCKIIFTFVVFAFKITGELL